MKTPIKSSHTREFQPFIKGKDGLTNIAKSTQKQAFALTCLVFLPLLLLFVSFSKPLKIEMKGQDAISLAMAQFVASGEFVAPKLAPAPNPKQDKKILKKERKKPRNLAYKRQSTKHGIKQHKNMSDKKEIKEQNLGGGAQVTNAQPTQIGTLAYGKDDNPFLREIKAAIDKAARETYPRQAVKMRLSGRVWLEFVWRTNSTLQAVRIVQSSGSQLLDRNVFKIVARASKDFPAYKDDIRIQIPIDYNLR